MTRALVTLVLATSLAAPAAAQEEPAPDDHDLRLDLMASLGGGHHRWPDQGDEAGVVVGQLDGRLVHASGHGVALRVMYGFEVFAHAAGMGDLAYLHRIVLSGDVREPGGVSLALDASAGLSLAHIVRGGFFAPLVRDTHAGLNAALSLDFRTGHFVTGLQIQYRALGPNGTPGWQHVVTGIIGAGVTLR